MGTERRGDTSVAACPPQCRDLGHVEDYGRILPCLRSDALELRLPAPAIARHDVAARGEMPGVLAESQEAVDTGAQRRDEPRARNGMARYAVADFVEDDDDVLAVTAAAIVPASPFNSRRRLLAASVAVTTRRLS